MKMILLDNGHGINTPGKRSPVWPDGSQLFEYEFNRDIVKRISKSLTEKNIDHKMIVPELEDISLPERIRRVNDICKSQNNCFLISIHANAGPKPNTGTGWEVWSSIGKTKSDEYATVFFNEAQIFFEGLFPCRADWSDGDPDKESDFAILSKTFCPAILTENLFFDNEKDCHFMLSEEGRNAIAQMHVKAIFNILNH